MRDTWETVKDWALILWLAFVEFVRWLNELSGRVNWTTWITHSVLGVPVGFTGALLFLVFLSIGFPSVLAAGLAANVTFWLWRESEQIAHRLLADVPLDTLDHVLDVLSPSVVVAVLAWWWMR